VRTADKRPVVAVNHRHARSHDLAFKARAVV
jgi:hypothetical protein